MLQGVNSDVLGWFHHLCFVLERINCCNSVVSSRFHNPCFARGRIKCSIITDKCQVFHKSPFHATKHKSPVNKTFGFVENSHRVSGLLLCLSNAPVRISNMSIINTQHGRVTPISTRDIYTGSPSWIYRGDGDTRIRSAPRQGLRADPARASSNTNS